MLRIPKNSLAFHLEEFLRTAEISNDAELSLPISLYLGGGLGSSVQVVQAISQIARNRRSKLRLRLPIDFSKSDATADRISSTLHGMAALYFSETVVSGESQISRRIALSPLATRVAAMDSQNFENTTRGVGVSLCCFSGARREYLSPLYYLSESGAVRPPKDFFIVLRRMVETLGPTAARSISVGQYESLSILLHELFQNADEHGAPGSDAGMRGVNIRVTPLGKMEDVVSHAGTDLALRTYLTRVLFRKNHASDDNPAVLELSVFDTGPGMGLNWLSKRNGTLTYRDMSLTDELDAVETCFQKHATTKASELRGQGLPTVLSALSRLGAFMTLRTGRVSLYQDFSNGSSHDFKPSPRFQNLPLALTGGTSFTVWFRIK